MDSAKPPDRTGIVEIVKALLPAPVAALTRQADRERDERWNATTLLGGSPYEVAVRITESTVAVAVYAAHWKGPCGLEIVPEKIVSFRWRRLSLQVLEPMIRQAIEAAREIRLSRFRRCELCGEMKPPEWMHNQTTCQGCAQNQLGVVY